MEDGGEIEYHFFAHPKFPGSLRYRLLVRTDGSNPDPCCNNGKYTPFHMIDEEDLERYKKVVKKVRKSKHAMKLEEWMMVHGDFKVVSSFSWAEH